VAGATQIGLIVLL